MAEVADLNKSFKKISRRLFRRSLNYCADFRLFLCKGLSGQSLDLVVKAALGKDAKVGGVEPVAQDQILEALEIALRFNGDKDSHPNLVYLGSIKSEEEINLVVSGIKGILEESELLLSFWLESGHPFYPVFWDFAFLIETADDAILFIASSSD